ncbi:DNA/RNA polymerase, partial [Rhizopogon vinicolor AM-OR11-026]
MNDKTFKDLVPEWLHQYESVFSEEASNRFPQRKKWDHKIDFKDNDDLPKKAKTYPLSPLEMEHLQKWLKQEYALGRLKDLESPIAAPFFFIPKKDGKLRPMMDYRQLNEKTVKN